MLLIGENASTQVMVGSYFNELSICVICKIKEKIITKKLVELGNCTCNSREGLNSTSIDMGSLDFNLISRFKLN